MTTDPGFTTPEMSRIFSAEARVSLMCRFEAELAGAQADLGIVPFSSAEAIAGACSTPPDDGEAILARGWEKGTPVLALLEVLRARLSGDDARWIHHGATTQDVVDTVLVLQIRAGLLEIGSRISVVSKALAELADSHRRTPFMGRTFLQDAIPTSFGVRVARWLHPLVGLRLEIDELSGRLPLQLGGPVGDMSPFGAQAFALADRLAGRLALVAPLIPWHTDRTPIIEAAGLVARGAASAAKIAVDISQLSATGEIRVRSGGSSSMPHKQNPVDAIRAAAAAQVCQTAVAGLVAGPPSHLERGIGAWHAEWELVPLAFQAGAASVEAIERAVGTLEADVAQMISRAGTDDPPETGLVDRVLDQYRATESE